MGVVGPGYRRLARPVCRAYHHGRYPSKEDGSHQESREGIKSWEIQEKPTSSLEKGLLRMDGTAGGPADPTKPGDRTFCRLSRLFPKPGMPNPAKGQIRIRPVFGNG
jgi:hypothetical protein